MQEMSDGEASYVSKEERVGSQSKVVFSRSSPPLKTFTTPSQSGQQKLGQSQRVVINYADHVKNQTSGDNNR